MLARGMLDYQKLEVMFIFRPKSFIRNIVLVLALPFFIISCAQRAPSKTAKAPTLSSGTPEADTDAALGVLPEKGKTEAEKQAGGIERDEEEQTLREVHQREMEEEQRRLQKRITEDRIVAGQG